jgi:hypothetical protein
MSTTTTGVMNSAANLKLRTLLLLRIVRDAREFYEAVLTRRLPVTEAVQPDR